MRQREGKEGVYHRRCTECLLTACESLQPSAACRQRPALQQGTSVRVWGSEVRAQALVRRPCCGVGCATDAPVLSLLRIHWTLLEVVVVP
jgi:hypothetical protein